MAGAPLWLATLSLLPAADPYLISGFWGALAMLWPVLLAGLAVYVWRPSKTGPDGLELAGRWLSQRLHDQQIASGSFPWHVLRDHLIKAFFLPLMLAAAYGWAESADPWQTDTRLQWYYGGVALILLLDTTFATIGYLTTSPRLGAQVRSSNPDWLAWIVTLACYPPFFTWLQRSGFTYRDGIEWIDWLGISHVLIPLWGAAILALMAITALSTVVFGVRFSNLTHRGIVTHGPYRWTKHPAYLSKNVAWWLISVPFVSQAGAATALTHCAILLGMNLIYWARAKTEECHLGRDPAYREYAAWIARHGLLAHMLRPLRKRIHAYGTS